MHFQIRHYEDEDIKVDGEVIIAGISAFDWQLERADGTVVCRSAGNYDTERELRSQLAKDKKSMAGCSRYKVKSPE